MKLLSMYIQSASSFYHHLTHHIVPGPQSLSYFIPLVLLPLALLIPRRTLSRWQSILLFMPPICLSTLHAWKAMDGVDVISVDVLLWSLYLLVLNDPWDQFIWISTSKESRKTITSNTTNASASKKNDSSIETPLDEGQYPTSLSSRIPWIGTLLVSIRLHNWRIGNPSHDNAQPPAPGFRNRTTFTLYTLLAFTRGYILLDLTSAWTTIDPYFTNPQIPNNSPLPSPHLQLIPPSLFRSLIISTQAWCLIGQMFYLPCLIPVLLNAAGLWPDLWSPQNWAPYFGSPSSIFHHGIRGFWGQYWHQMMRHSTAGPGYAIADILGLKSGGLGRYAIITTVAFGLSGVVHMGLVPPEPLHATVPVDAIRLSFAMFFWVQPIGLLIEAVMMRIVRGARRRQGSAVEKPSMLMCFLKGLWVVLWFYTCIPLLGEGGRQLGYWRNWLVPFSLWRLVRGEDPVMWSLLK